jgi:hypothetical protein
LIASLSLSCDLCTQMVSVSLDCPFLIVPFLRHVSCVPNGVSVSWLSILDCSCVFVLCVVYANCVSVSWLYIIDCPFVFVLCLVYPNGVSVSWLSIIDCPFVFVLCLVLPNGVSVSWLYLCLWDLRIPKGLSGAINRKRTNNTMAKKVKQSSTKR